MLYGRGAGDLPTGSAVVGDIISILRNNVDLSTVTSIKSNMDPKKIQDSSENVSGYYIRLDVKDQPGILGEVAAVLGKNDISVLSISQNVKSTDSASMVFMTHETKEGNINKSIKTIKGLDKVNKVVSVIRIENFS